MRHGLRWALAALAVLGASAIMVIAILLVRRRAPEGGYFSDGDRAAGVFGVLATGFALLLGFVIFLAFTKFDGSRAGAEAEALAVVQLFETAQLMPADAGPELAGEVECYARSVVSLEWPAMEEGSGSDAISPWGFAMLRTIQSVEPETASEESAYDSWLAQSNARQEARRDRLHAADGVVPLPVWIVLLLTAVLVLGYLLFFADSGERALVQALLAGSVTAVIVASLLVLASLNRPYDQDVGGIRPVAMERSLEIISAARVGLDLDEPVPCDAIRATPVSAPPQGRSTADARIDAIAAVLLAMAAVATAWSSYQASRWTGEQAKAFSAANAARLESTRSSGLANAQTQVDVAVFTQWVDAELREETELAAFYEQRFRDEFKPAFQAWLRTDPFNDPTAPPSPFAMDEYQLAATQQAGELSATAETSAELARTNIQRATNYVLGVVLFATALFFAGISTRLSSTRLRAVILGIGCLVFIVAASWIATFPVNLTI